MQLSHLLPVIAGLVSVTTAATATTCTYAKATPTPAGYTCDVQGSVKKPAVLFSSSPIPSLQNCAQRCINEPNCLSYGYNAGSKTCTFYKKTLANQGFAPGNTGVTFAARNCYTCQCAAGLTKCGNNCFNIKTDNSNCGKCGNVCTNGATCKQGACICPRPGFIWRISAADSAADGYYIGLLKDSSSSNQGALTAIPSKSNALTFKFQGTNATTVYQNVSALAVVDNQGDPAMNPPNVNNTDGQQLHGTVVRLGATNETSESTTPATCSATAQRQLAIQAFGTLNKLQLCELTNDADQFVLVLADGYINTEGFPPCDPVAIDLVCA